jgi:hypothetical protein
VVLSDTPDWFWDAFPPKLAAEGSFTLPGVPAGHAVAVRFEAPAFGTGRSWVVPGKSAAVVLRKAGADDQVWLYTFVAGAGGYDVVVGRGREAAHEPLAGPKLSVTHNAGAGAAPGESVVAEPGVAAGDRYLTKCEVGTRFAASGREAVALIELTEPGGGAVDRAFSGFS